MKAHNMDRWITLWLWKFGLESCEHHLLLQLTQPGMKVVDIGATIGYHTICLAQCVGDSGCVRAFEPDPHNFAVLEDNPKNNRCRNTSTLNKAVGAETGRQLLFLSPSLSGDHRLYSPQDVKNVKRKTLEVDVVALDDFFISHRIDLIKMDIQGAEGLALSGMHKILTIDPPPSNTNGILASWADRDWDRP
jgi:FkbM family methyltransferase